MLLNLCHEIFIVDIHTGGFFLCWKVLNVACAHQVSK